MFLCSKISAILVSCYAGPSNMETLTIRSFCKSEHDAFLTVLL
uniref:Uncharacterized protein n=1 Tax=Arundo donax TaxID=35708 RepID=A0A0A9SLZ0_ARUDO